MGWDYRDGSKTDKELRNSPVTRTRAIHSTTRQTDKDTGKSAGHDTGIKQSCKNPEARTSQLRIYTYVDVYVYVYVYVHIYACRHAV